MYKIIKDNKVLDIVRYPDFIRFLPTGIVVRTAEDIAQGIVGSDNQTFYSFEPVDDKTIQVVTIEKISEEEFNRLSSLLNSNQVVIADETVLKQAREEKIRKLSETCRNTITDGFSLRLQDGNKYSFKLTAEDQLNLLNLENQLSTGEKTFVYHATGLPCQVFIREDIQKIIKAYRKHILYHTTYFNTAKQYINTLNDLAKIKSFTYGMKISGSIKDPTLRQILREGGANR